MLAALSIRPESERACPPAERPMKVIYWQREAVRAARVCSLVCQAWPRTTFKIISEADDLLGAEAQLLRQECDVILAEVAFPCPASDKGLRRIRENWPDVPFILLTEAAGESRAIEEVEQGRATDYVLPEQLHRLVMVTRRALRERQARHEWRLSVESLRQSEERYRKIFAYNPLPMWIVEASTLTFLDVNEAAVLHYGYSREEFRQMTLTDVSISAPTSPLFAVPLPAADARPETKLREHRKKEGSTMTVELFTLEIDYAGKAAHLALINDVTASRAAAQKIRQLNGELERRVEERTARLEAAMKDLEAFSYSVSHDLRSPLRGIDGFARALMEDFGPTLDPEGRRLITTIRSETRRMGQLIDDLLAFSRAGRQQLDAAPVDMTELARSAFQNILEASPLRHPALQLHPLPEAMGDRALLRQVFANLLDNAVKFSSQNPAPAIEISGRREAGVSTYAIKDNGVGFDPRLGHKLFGVFQRLHRQEEFEGTGVGLALVQRIVHRHGGKTWAESTPKCGATFYFTLPDSPGVPPESTRARDR